MQKASTVTQQTTVALNDGVAEFIYNPQWYDLDGNGIEDPNGTEDYFIIIFEPGDFTAYGTQFPFQVTGVGFMNNDDQTTWPDISVVPVVGSRASWSINAIPLTSRTNVTNLASGDVVVNFPSPATVNESTTLAVLMKFPQGGRLTAVGSGGGPGIGGDVDATDNHGFPPTGIAARNYNSWVSTGGSSAAWMQHSDGLPVNLVVNLIVDPISAPDIDVNPNFWDYGAVSVGTSVSKVFVVTNQGMADLNVSSVTLTGGNSDEFRIDQGGGAFTLLPGGTMNVSMGFNPSTEGTKTTALRFVSDDPNESPLDVPLSGTASTAGACFPQPVGLGHWWPGDGNTNDVVGNQDGSLQQGTDGRTEPSQAYTAGTVGQGFILDGVDDYIVTSTIN